MLSAINSALSGLAVHTAVVNTAAGNLANLNTSGYKSSRLDLGTLGTVSGTGGEAGQGALEGSNVDPAREMVNLMLGQQGFAASIKVLQTTGEMLGTILDIRA